jgi:hypothetical protein
LDIPGGKVFTLASVADGARADGGELASQPTDARARKKPNRRMRAIDLESAVRVVTVSNRPDTRAVVAMFDFRQFMDVIAS